MCSAKKDGWILTNNLLVKKENVVAAQFVPGSQSSENSVSTVKLTSIVAGARHTTELPMSEPDFKELVKILRA